MNRHHALLTLFISLFFIISGCLSADHPGNKINYYTLDYTPVEINDRVTLPHVLRVERFTVSPLYNSSSIIYQENRYKRDAYHYHKWRANPGDLVTYFLARDLKASALFKGVFSMDSRFASTHEIEGVVDEFFEWDEKGEAWKAVLSVSITLLTESEPDISKKIVFQKQYKEMQACEQKNPKAVAEAMSIAMSRVSIAVINDVYSHLSNMD
jgi:cholesterol transport system auxiliary component